MKDFLNNLFGSNTNAFSGFQNKYAPTTVKKPPVTSMSPAATSPVPVTPSLAKSSLTTPAAKGYVDSVYPDSSTMAKNRVALVSGSNGTLKEVNGQVVPSIQSTGTTNPTPPSPGPSTTTTGGGTTFTGGINDTSSNDPYLRYLTGLFDENKLNETNKARQEFDKRQSDELLRSRARDEELRKNDIGQLERGQSYQLGENERLSNKSLADIAIARSPYDTAYNQMIDAGKSVYEATVAAKKAEQDQKNIDAENASKAVDQGLARDKFISESDLAKKKFDEDTRQFGLTYAQNQQKIDADNPSKNGTTDAKKNDALSSVNIINSLLSNPGINAITGIPGISALIPGTDAQLAKNQYNQIKGILSLENRGKLKGQGAVSDFEGKTLDRAASSLGRNLSNDEFKNQLTQIKGSILTSNGLPALVQITDPNTGLSQTVQSDSTGIAHAVEDGLLVTYK